jgi:hypothetical protein
LSYKTQAFFINFVVSRAGIEPARPEGHRIFLPTTAFAACKKAVCGLDFTFTFYCKITAVRREPSSLYTFLKTRKFSNLARYCHIKGFTEFDSIHTEDFASDAQRTKSCASTYSATPTQG